MGGLISALLLLLRRAVSVCGEHILCPGMNCTTGCWGSLQELASLYDHSLRLERAAFSYG